jgi:methyl-accepting chemotaxis protein
MCSWLIALSFVYPLIIANLFDYLIMTLAHEPQGPQVAGLLEMRESLLWLLIGMQITLTGLTFIISLFMSHKIAGPLLKLKRYFREARDGNITQILDFRKKDYFRDLVPEYNAMMKSIHTKFEGTTASITSSILILEKAREKSGTETSREIELALKTLKDTLKK